MTEQEKQDLIANYIELIIENMDLKTMACFIDETLQNEFNQYTEKQLLNEIGEFYPHLLEGADHVKTK